MDQVTRLLLQVLLGETRDLSYAIDVEGGAIWPGHVQHHRTSNYHKGYISTGGEQSCSPPTGGTSMAQRTSCSGCKAKPTVKLTFPADQYHNPDPIVRLIGRKNESIIKIENQEFTALIDPGAHILTICTSLVEKLKLPVHSLAQILYVEPTGGGLVVYEGYLEVNLKVPGISALNEDVLMLVVNDSAYSERVPMALGTIHVDQVFQLIKDWEFLKNEPWYWQLKEQYWLKMKKDSH